MAKLPTWTKTDEVVRGIKIKGDNSKNEIQNILKRYPVGKTIPHEELISVGSNSKASFLEKPEVKIEIHMELAKKSTAKDISALADGIMYRGNPKHELLFPSNTTFLVVDKYFDSNRERWILLLKEI
jgi:hypothetical protein